MGSVLQPPLLTQTVPEHFASIVGEYGDRMAVISKSQNERLSYRELDERSNILARGLRERGVKKGDRVAVSLGNNWEFAVLTYALFKLGAILVCLPFLWSLQELMKRTGAVKPSIQLTASYSCTLAPLG